MKALRVTVLLLPFIALAVYWSAASLPHSISLMSAPSDPWYTPYTTNVILLGSFWAFPANCVCGLLEIPLFGAMHFGILLIYTFLCSAVLAYYFHTRFVSRKASAEQDAAANP
jgi:hypothetical protein